MLKKALMLAMAAASLCLSGLASAENYMYDDSEWEQPRHTVHPGGHFSIHVVPPARYYEPPPRCLPGHRVDEMQAEQTSRIYAGRQEGDLTRSEMDALLSQQNHIAAIEARMRNDGCLTVHERNDLLNRLEQAGRNIWRERNDNERRGEYHRPHHGGWGGDRY